MNSVYSYQLIDLVIPPQLELPASHMENTYIDIDKHGEPVNEIDPRLIGNQFVSFLKIQTGENRFFLFVNEMDKKHQYKNRSMADRFITKFHIYFILWNAHSVSF